MGKIQDDGEVRRWFEEGRTYAWMVEKYREKYNIETTISMWGNYRRRNGLDRRYVWDDTLVPWKIKPEHNYDNPVLMLRREARRRAGRDLSEEQEHELNTWISGLKARGEVVHYDPTTTQGFWFLPARPGIDTDLVRVPETPQLRRRESA